MVEFPRLALNFTQETVLVRTLGVTLDKFLVDIWYVELLKRSMLDKAIYQLTTVSMDTFLPLMHITECFKFLAFPIFFCLGIDQLHVDFFHP